MFKRKKHDYHCKKCGYKAVKLGKLADCPLCIICVRCGKPVRECICLEGE